MTKHLYGALIVLSITATGVHAASDSHFLSAEEVQAKLVGKEYRGTGFSERYEEDGKLRTVWGSHIVRGTWHINDASELCVAYRGNNSQYNGCWKIRAGGSATQIIYVRGEEEIIGNLVK